MARLGSSLAELITIASRWEEERIWEEANLTLLGGHTAGVDTDGDPCMAISHLTVECECSIDWKKKYVRTWMKDCPEVASFGFDPNAWDSKRRLMRQAPVFRAKAKCGLALSSVAPWEVRSIGGYVCRACKGLWRPGLGGGRQCTLFGKCASPGLLNSLKDSQALPPDASGSGASSSASQVPGPSAWSLPAQVPHQVIKLASGERVLATQLEMDEPPGKEWNSYCKSKVAFQKRFMGTEPLRDVPLPSELKASKRIKLEGQASTEMWKILLKHPEGECLRALEQIAREANSRRK